MAHGLPEHHQHPDRPAASLFPAPQLTRQGLPRADELSGLLLPPDQNISSPDARTHAGDSFRARETGHSFVFCLPCRERPSCQ